jgi:hypothetical protein
VTEPWRAALPPASATVACAAGPHRLRWKEGVLSAPAHPDSEAELVLTALGGDETECLRLVRLWSQHADDLNVFTIGPRTPTDRLKLVRDERATVIQLTAPLAPRRLAKGHRVVVTAGIGPPSVAHVVARHNALRRSGFDPVGEHRVELLALLALGPAFQLRLTATVASAWADRKIPPSTEPRLAQALAGRLAPVAAGWLGIDPDQVQVSRHDGPGWGDLERTESGLRATLPLSWLASVWAAGLSVVDGRLAVGVTEVNGPRATVLAVRRPGDRPEPLTVVRRASKWTVTP